MARLKAVSSEPAAPQIDAIPAETALATPAEAIAEAVEAATDVVVAAPVAEVAAPAAAASEHIVATAQTAQTKVKQGMDKMVKGTEELVSFGQGNAEALMKSGQIWVAGVQDLSKQFAAAAQTTLDETVSTFKAISGVKSLQEAFELQSTLARTTMERAMADSGKLADASAKLAEQIFAPLTARMTQAVERFGKGF